MPEPTPVTIPSLVTVATDMLLLVQVPPVVGESVVVEPSQMVVGPVIAAVGGLSTVMLLVALEEQPVEELVNEKLAVPVFTPVTLPALFTVATVVMLLTHVPPEVGESCVMESLQITEDPVIEAVGLALMTIVLSFDPEQL